MSVLTLFASTSYILFTAALICLLFALTSQMNTKVLFPSIFFMADSVFNGYRNTWKASKSFVLGTDRRGYFGVRGNRNVFGR